MPNLLKICFCKLSNVWKKKKNTWLNFKKTCILINHTCIYKFVILYLIFFSILQNANIWRTDEEIEEEQIQKRHRWRELKDMTWLTNCEDSHGRANITRDMIGSSHPSFIITNHLLIIRFISRFLNF